MELSVSRFKVCTKCGCTKPATFSFFHKRKNGLHGLYGPCKVCRCAIFREYRAQNREAYNEKTRQYLNSTKERRNKQRREDREKNSEKIRAKARAWYQANREKVCERERERRARPEVKRKNKESQRKRLKAERLANPERFAAQARRRRARKLSAPGTHRNSEIKQMHRDQGGLCAYCQEPLSGKGEVEHMVPLSRGGSDDWSNIAIACRTCNASKGVMTSEEFWESGRVRNS